MRLLLVPKSRGIIFLIFQELEIVNRNYSVAEMATLIDLAEGDRAAISEDHYYTKRNEDFFNSCSVIHNEKV